MEHEVRCWEKEHWQQFDDHFADAFEETELEPGDFWPFTFQLIQPQPGDLGFIVLLESSPEGTPEEEEKEIVGKTYADGHERVEGEAHEIDGQLYISINHFGLLMIESEQLGSLHLNHLQKREVVGLPHNEEHVPGEEGAPGEEVVETADHPNADEVLNNEREQRELKKVSHISEWKTNAIHQIQDRLESHHQHLRRILKSILTVMIVLIWIWRENNNILISLIGRVRWIC